MKKILASLPIIGLILGAVAIATELKKPMDFGEISSVHVPVCQTMVHKKGTISSPSGVDQDLVICAQ